MRSQELTAAIVAPPVAPFDNSVRQLVRHSMLGDIPGLVEKLPTGARIVVTRALLRQAQQEPEALAQPEEPFIWKPTFVRRSLGLSAIDACIRQRFSTPGQAVGAVADEAVTEWKRTGWRTFHWEPWFAALNAAARSGVVAEATTWATTLWSSIDWGRFDCPLQLGGPDDQWTIAAPRSVRLKGPSELQIPLVDPHGDEKQTRGTALVSVAGGVPFRGWEEELGYLALVAAMRSPSRPVPSRVIGLWPDAGIFHSVDITAGVFTAAGHRVTSCIAALVQARTSTVQ